MAGLAEHRVDLFPLLLTHRLSDRVFQAFDALLDEGDAALNLQPESGGEI